MRSAQRAPRATLALAAAGLLAALLALQCSAPAGAGAAASAGAWETVYAVLQHPRCVNCHPAGDAPLQGEAGLPHAQNVQRGPVGHGLFGMRCDTCHSNANAPGPHLPPGAPGWHLPHPNMPLVFEGRSSPDLCRQLRDPAHNGGRTTAELLHHVDADPLVLWGWSPGEGRAPVDVTHAEFVRAVRAWVEGGCGCPGD